ncbi:MAG: leishmanolysin-related zinc metalloendopeptidase [Alphaproteobacteria bacterium]
MDSDLDQQQILRSQDWNWDDPVWKSDDIARSVFDGVGTRAGVDDLVRWPGAGGDTMISVDRTSPADFTIPVRNGSGGAAPASSGSGLITTYNAGIADGEAGYDIRIDFTGTGWTADLQKAFKDAADYFTKVITRDIGGGAYYGGIYVDDLYMTAELRTIDGAGGILGQAGPSSIWNSTELTARGKMQFDSADALSYLKKGTWDDIVTHEMMHVLGFGSLWNFGKNPLVTAPGQYTGKAGLAAYQAAGHSGASFIPVETDGGPGTAGAHWDEQALGNELMTGYINNSNYLSSFSLMSLADLGYAAQPLPWPGSLVS